MATYPIKMKNTAKPLPISFVPKSDSARKLLNKLLRYIDAGLYSLMVGIYSTGVFFKESASRISVRGARLDYKKTKRNAILIISSLLVLEAVASMALFRKYSVPITPEDQTSVNAIFSPLISGTETSSNQAMSEESEIPALLATLKKEGFTGAVLGKTNEPKLAVSGNIISLGTDTISVFEYMNQQQASQQAIALANRYNSDITQNMWGEQIHVYVNGNLLVYYFGTKTSVISALASFAGSSLVQLPVETKNNSSGI